jgi:phosphate starvation-inducible membrane PsiE
MFEFFQGLFIGMAISAPLIYHGAPEPVLWVFGAIMAVVVTVYVNHREKVARWSKGR